MPHRVLNAIVSSHQRRAEGSGGGPWLASTGSLCGGGHPIKKYALKDNYWERSGDASNQGVSHILILGIHKLMHVTASDIYHFHFFL